MGKISIDLQGGKVKKETINIIGIDLGTSNSLVAFTEEGKTQIIKDMELQTNLVASILHFKKDGGIIIGKDAKRSNLDAKRTIFSVKRLLGKSYEDLLDYQSKLSYKIIAPSKEDGLVQVVVDNQFYSPVLLSSYILKKLKESAEEALEVEITRAVITVPAYFNDIQRQATRDAGKLAGLDVMRIINEPTAASLAYGIGMDKEVEEKVVVYDLGGGTFDISILHIEDRIFEVLATHGDSFLGGDDFDNLIVNYWYAQYPALQEAFKEEQQVLELKYIAEEAKKVLSEKDTFSRLYKGIDIKIDLPTFNELIQPLVDATIQHCKKAMTDAELVVGDIDRVVMVGGSTRVPLIQSSIASFFKKPVYNELNPDEVVAIGASIQADILAGNNKDFLLLDISPLSLGIETVGGLMDVIIPRNTKIPARFARNYTTSVDGQTNLKVTIYQGERDLIGDNRLLGEFVLRKIPPMAAGMPKIEIQFMLDVDGILTVKAKELRSGVESQIEIKSAYGISEEEMGKMLLDSIINAERDMTAKALLEAITEGNHIVLSTKKFIKNNKNMLSLDEINRLGLELEKLINEIDKKDKDGINKAIQDLNEYSSPIAHKAMDINISNALKGVDM